MRCLHGHHSSLRYCRGDEPYHAEWERMRSRRNRRGRGAYGCLFLPLYARIPAETHRASEQYQEEGRGRYSAAVPGADSGAARVRQTENRNHGRAAEAAPRSTACKIAHPMLKAGKITKCQNVKTGRRR